MCQSCTRSYSAPILGAVRNSFAQLSHRAFLLELGDELGLIALNVK